MKKRTVVTCNKGFISAKMTYIEAVQFAHQLEKLGNYGVRVVMV